MLNRICAAGRLGHSPEMRRLDDGKAVTTFSIACDRDFKNKSGERETDWLDVVCYGNTAEFAGRYLEKGRVAIVTGRLQIRSWTNKDGDKRRAAEIVADSVYFGDSRNDNQSNGFSAPHGVPVQADFPVIDEDDAGLPF